VSSSHFALDVGIGHLAFAIMDWVLNAMSTTECALLLYSTYVEPTGRNIVLGKSAGHDENEVTFSVE
jgi:hypothetical protein